MVSVFNVPRVNTRGVGRTGDKRRKPRREAIGKKYLSFSNFVLDDNFIFRFDFVWE